MGFKNLTASWQKSISVANLLLDTLPWRSRVVAGFLLWCTMSGGTAVHAQRTEAAATWDVLICPPHATPESRKLSTSLPGAIDEALRKRIPFAGYSVAPAKKTTEEKSCAQAGYIYPKKNSKPSVRWVVDVRVQRNDGNTYHVVDVLYDAQREENTIDLSLAQVPNGRQPESADEAELVHKIAEQIAGMIESAAKAPPPFEVVTPLPPKLQPALNLEVKVVGPGRVVSNPAGIDCPFQAKCSARFAPTGQPAPIILTATPTGAAAAVVWEGTACTNLPLTDPYRCEQQANDDLKPALVKVGFERTAARKIGTGVLGGLAGAALISSAVLLGLAGQDAGGCTDRGVMYSDGCVYNFVPASLLSAGIAVGLGGGAALFWWLPIAKEPKK